MPKDDIVQKLGSLVTQFGSPELPISGAIPGEGDTERAEIVLALDPSKRYGTPSPERSEHTAVSVERDLGWTRTERLVPAARIIMGRLEGYKIGSQPYPLEEVKARAEEIDVKISATLGFESADLFSLRFTRDGLRQWIEPGVMVTADDPAATAALDVMLELAHDLQQDRVVVELPGGIAHGQPHPPTQVYEMPRE